MMTEQEHNNVQWRKVKLGEVGEINPSNKEPIPNQFIYIDLESVVAGKLLVENYILKENAPSRAQRLVYNNDVLYQTVRPYQKNNYIHKNQGNYVASTGYALIRCYDDYEPDFVYYLLHTHNFESIVLGLCTGTSYPAIAPNNLKRIKISIPFKNNKPDLSAQRRIAAILTSADKVIAATQKTIAKYKQIKQGMMEELFNEQCTMNNVQWRKVRLGEVCVIHGRIGFRGYTTDDLVEKGYGAITFSPSDIHDFKLCYDDCDYISWEKYEESPEIKAFNGDILFCKTASIGKCAYVEGLKEKATINPQFVVLKNFQCDSKFLFYKLVSYGFQTQVQGITGGSTIKTMSQEKLGLEEISIPNLSEQRRIAAILSGIDAKIAAEEKVLEKYEKVKKGLMERLINGEMICSC